MDTLQGQCVAWISNTGVFDTQLEHLKKSAKELKILDKESNLSTLPRSSFDAVVLIQNDTPSLDTIFAVFNVLKPKGILVLLEPLAQRTFEKAQATASHLTIAGFSNAKISDLNGFVQTITQKPDWQTGALSSITIKKKGTTTSTGNNQAKKEWSFSNNEDYDVIEDEALLTEQDLLKPKKVDDCEIGTTKKACKNCSCGRAENESDTKPKLTLEMLENPGVGSSCGSCGLGDAFRCKGCPYRGLPAFKPGEKVTLPDDFAIDDI
eukprot:TRINITY_DN8399_c0_g1_i1.p1 TRINITY_DN8399_c0_g1~~TRINITY_DN8399_c0_g1_i1.p1  ORF type:complete len:265 (-),score=55.88 TRINITY_DN8399_c0_g1_i1:30-824(-)